MELYLPFIPSIMTLRSIGNTHSILIKLFFKFILLTSSTNHTLLKINYDQIKYGQHVVKESE